MIHLVYSDPIEKVGLSTRSYNALRRNGFHTIEALLSLNYERLSVIRNLGMKSLNEILKLKKEILSGSKYKLVEASQIDFSIPDEHITAPSFLDANGMHCWDVKIVDLGLSFRANRILTEAGYEFASSLLDIKTEQLLELPSMGWNTATEIIERIANIKFDIVDRRDKKATQAEADCLEFICALSAHYPIHAGGIYEVLLQHFEDSFNQGYSIEYDILFQEPCLQNLVANKILTMLEHSLFGIKKEYLISACLNTLVSVKTINAVLDDLSSREEILINDVIEIIRPSLWEYVNSILDNKQRDFLTRRLQGNTLEEIGHVSGVTRERVRQVIKKCLSKKHVLIKEDKYRKIYETYEFSKDDFLLAFDTDDTTFTYLTLICEAGGTRPSVEFLDDEDYPICLRHNAERAVYKNFITINGTRVPKRRLELANYVIHTYFQDDAKYDAFVETYNNLLSELGLIGDSQFTLHDRSYQNRLADSDNVLWKYPSRFRYYDIAGHDFSALLYGLNLEQYVDVEYSTLKFFRSYPYLMDEYDIRDEYELHNLLKKLYAKKKHHHLSFSRMPMVEFGKPDRNNQVLDLLIHLAPISIEAFCSAYEAEYGVLARTVAGSFLACIDIYRNHAGMFDISAEPLPVEQMRVMQKLLCGDFYDIAQIVQLYSREFPDANPNMINSYTLKSMGFNVFSSYVIKDSFASATEYFRNLLTSEEIVNANEFSSALTSQVAYTSELYSLKSRYEIVEFEPLHFISRRRLDLMGATVQDFADYCDQVSNFVKPKHYFTIQSLRKSGFSHSLDRLEFGDWFYASVLAEDKERYRYQRMGGSKVFCKNVKQITMEGLFEFIVKPFGSIHVSDFMDILNEKYALRIDKYKILEVLSNSSMNYDRSTGRIECSENSVSGMPHNDECKKVTSIVASNFKNGYRISSNIDFERFKNFYMSVYSEEFILSSNDLEYIMNTTAVIYDERAYVFDVDVIEYVCGCFEMISSPCIYINSFFEEYVENLYSKGIFSVDIFKAFVEKNCNEVYCKGNYLYLQRGITPTDLIRQVFDEQATWTFEELSNKFPYIAENTIRQTLSRDEFFRIESNAYAHISNIILPDDDGNEIICFIENKLQVRDYVNANEMDLSPFERKNPHYPFLAIRDAVFNKFLAGQYNKNGQLITRQGEKLRLSDVLDQFCHESEEVSLDELNSIEAMLDPKGRTHSQSLVVALNNMIRVSDKLFVSKSKVEFDVKGIDEIISLYCAENFVPIKNVVDLTLFPYPGYQWNLFLLESYVRKFSYLFKFDVRAANSSNVGVIVKKSFAYDGYDEIMAIALAKSQTPLDDRKAIGNYLYDNGYIGWRNLGKSENTIVKKARFMREEAVK